MIKNAVKLIAIILIGSWLVNQGVVNPGKLWDLSVRTIKSGFTTAASWSQK